MNEEFESFIDQALKELPVEFRDKLDNVSIFVEDLPTQEQLHKLQMRSRGHTLLGLYEGIPHIKRGSYGIGGPMPDRITLFRFPILSMARSKDHLVQIIQDTLWHEIGHHFGMSEEELQKAQRRK